MIACVAGLQAASPSEDCQGGTVNFSNFVPSAGVDLPIFEGDGTTRLSGPSFVAQLWGGPSGVGEWARDPIGDPAPFGVGPGAGYFSGGVRTICSVPAGAFASIQVRLWDTRVSDTFAGAVAAGVGYAWTPTLEVRTGGLGDPPSPPADLIGLEPPKLGGGLPVTIDRQPENAVRWVGAWVRWHVQASTLAGIPLTFQWQREEQGSWQDLPGETSPTLELFRLKAVDAGRFRVVVSAFSQNVASRAAELRVIGPPTLHGRRLADGAFEITLTVPIGLGVEIQTTSDFGSWSDVGEAASDDGTITFLHEEAADLPYQFYRVVGIAEW